MGYLQKTFQESIGRVVYEKYRDLIAEKIQDNGISLSEQQKEELLKAVQAGSLESFSLELPDDHGEDRVVTLDEEDEEQFLERMATYEEKLLSDESIESIVKAAADAGYQALRENWPSIGEEREADHSLFLEEIDSYWHEPIQLLEQMRYVAIVSSNTGIDDVNERYTSEELLDNALLKFNVGAGARAIQLLGEIIALVRNGYAEGALARWRSLHELNVTLHFISEHGEDVARRYFAHEIVESRKAAREYSRVHAQLGYPPLADSELDEIERDYRRVVALYGPSFRGSYGWASDALGKDHITFSEIEDSVNLGHMRGYYRMASHGVHANPKGITFRMSQPPDQIGLIAGPSVYGLSDAITNAAITTMQICSVMATEWSSIDALVSVAILQKLCDEVNMAVVKVEERLNSDATN